MSLDGMSALFGGAIIIVALLSYQLVLVIAKRIKDRKERLDLGDQEDVNS